MKGLEGLSIDEKYEIEEYRDMMKDFAMAATEGKLEQVGNLKNERILDTKVIVKLLDPGLDYKSKLLTSVKLNKDFDCI